MKLILSLYQSAKERDINMIKTIVKIHVILYKDTVNEHAGIEKNIKPNKITKKKSIMMLNLDFDCV